MQNSSRISTKTIPRNNRAETRSRAKDELRRVISAIDKSVVRKWERRWVVLKDSSVSVLKWVPISGPSGGVVPPKVPVVQTTNDENSTNGNGGGAIDETTQQSALSAGNNSNEDTTDVNMTAMREDEDSNAAVDFSDMGAFDSDSQTFERVDYHKREANNATKSQPTDFSGMRNEESTKAGGEGIGAESNEASSLRENSLSMDGSEMFQLR